MRQGQSVVDLSNIIQAHWHLKCEIYLRNLLPRDMEAKQIHIDLLEAIVQDKLEMNISHFEDMVQQQLT